MDEPGSPQNKAIEWLQSESGLNRPAFKLIQRYVLATFWFATNGEGWNGVASWLGPDDECDWKIYDPWDSAREERRHLYCNGDGSFVALNLDMLGGSIPKDIALLSNLEWLDVPGREVTGSIPSEFGLLTKLKVLRIDIITEPTAALVLQEVFLLNWEFFLT